MKLKKLLPLTLLLTCARLHAAQMVEEGYTPTYLKQSQVRPLLNDDQQDPYSKVFNHTQQHSSRKVNNAIDAEDLPNREELTKDIKDVLDTLLFKAKSEDLLLGALLRRGDNKAPHEKYVLSTGGLLGRSAHRAAHNARYHLVQTQPSHIIPALLQWMQVGPFKDAPLLLTSGPICSHCDTLLKITRDKDHALEVKKEDCNGKPFPWPMPPAAQDFLGKTIQRAPQPFALIDPFVLQLMGTVNQQQHQQVQAARNTLANQIATLQESTRHHNETLNKAQIAHQNAKKKIEELENQVTRLQQYDDDAKENDQQKEETIQAQATRIALLEGQLQKLNGPLDKKKRTEWFEAAEKGDFQTLQQLYHTYQVDSNVKDNDGYTALMCAANSGKKETVAWLIQQGKAQVNLQDNYGCTALMHASQEGKKETVAYLIQLGAQVDLQINKEVYYKGWTALMCAARWDKKETVASLIELGAQVNLQNNEGETALMIAACWGKKKTVACLIEQGHARIDLKNKQGKTALALATEFPLSNQEGTIAYLRRGGAK